MKLQSTFKKLALAAGIAAALPFAAMAQGGPGGPGGPEMHQRHHGGEGMRGMHGRHHGPSFLRGINLTEAQRDKVFAIRHAQAPVMREKFKIVRKSHEDLRALTTSAQYDDAKARAIADTGARAMAELAVLKARGDHDIYALLTPEQKAQADKMKADWEARRAAGPEGRRGMGGPGGQRGMGPGGMGGPGAPGGAAPK
jgi:Spy/CpxP family protein refolding chaperone